jgi:hypothetical protein
MAKLLRSAQHDATHLTSRLDPQPLPTEDPSPGAHSSG